jgi:hypothetical protein
MKSESVEPQSPNNRGPRRPRLETGQVADEQHAHTAAPWLTRPTSPYGQVAAEQPAHLEVSQLTPPTSPSGRGIFEQPAHLAASQLTPLTSLSPASMPPQPGSVFGPISSLLAAEPTRSISLPAAPPSTFPPPQPRNDWSYPQEGRSDDPHDTDMSEMEDAPDWPWPRLSFTRVEDAEDLHDLDTSEMEGEPDWPWPRLSLTRSRVLVDAGSQSRPFASSPVGEPARPTSFPAASPSAFALPPSPFPLPRPKSDRSCPQEGGSDYLYDMAMTEMEGEPDWPWPRLSITREEEVDEPRDMDMSEMESELDWPWPRLSLACSHDPMDASPLHPLVATGPCPSAPSPVSQPPVPTWQQPDSPPPSPHHHPLWMSAPFSPPGEDMDDYHDRRLSEMAEEADRRNARERALRPHAPRHWWHVGNGEWQPSSPRSPQSSQGSTEPHHPVYIPVHTDPYGDADPQASDWAPSAQSQPSPLSPQSSLGSTVPETEDSSSQLPPRETMQGEDDWEYHDHHREVTPRARDLASSVQPPPSPRSPQPSQGWAETVTGDPSSQRPPRGSVSLEEDPAYSDHHGGAGPRAGDRTPPVQPPSRGGWAEP